MGDKGERGVKNLKKWMTLFVDGPLKVYVRQLSFMMFIVCKYTIKYKPIVS